MIKKGITAILVAGILAACGGNKNEENTTEEDGPGISETISGLKNLSTLSDKAADMESLQKKLAGLTPLTNEELKTAIPDDLIGLKRSKLSVGNQLVALSTAEATYTDADKNKKIELTIMDGAGETGSAFMSLRVMGLAMEREEETESGFSKITDLQGYRAEVKQNTYNEQTDSEIGFVAKDRYHISLQGSNMTLEELEEAVRQLNLSELK